jgi:apolipoprotein N-acyltransferase
MTPLLANLWKGQKGNLGWAGVCLVMVLGAYLAQGERNEAVLLELGTLRATVTYQQQEIDKLKATEKDQQEALADLTERCYRD